MNEEGKVVLPADKDPFGFKEAVLNESISQLFYGPS